MIISERDEIVAPRLGVAVVGCGGAGNNALNNLDFEGTDNLKTIALNTDAGHLVRIKANSKILIGREFTGGRGAGGNVALARKAAELSRDRLKTELRGSSLVFILSGMGGGTGTGTAPVVASVARETGALAVSITSMPFDFERGRVERARDYVRELIHESDSTVIMENSRLVRQFPELTMQQAFAVMDTLTSQIVTNVSGSLLKPSMMNIDYADMRTIFRGGGTSTVICSENEDVRALVDDAARHPLLQTNLARASGAVVHVSGGEALTLEKTHGILKGISDFIGSRAHIIMGARQVDRNDSVLSVTAIVTGVRPESW